MNCIVFLLFSVPCSAQFVIFSMALEKCSKVGLFSMFSQCSAVNPVHMEAQQTLA